MIRKILFSFAFWVLILAANNIFAIDRKLIFESDDYKIYELESGNQRVEYMSSVYDTYIGKDIVHGTYTTDVLQTIGNTSNYKVRLLKEWSASFPSGIKVINSYVCFESIYLNGADSFDGGLYEVSHQISGETNLGMLWNDVGDDPAGETCYWIIPFNKDYKTLRIDYSNENDAFNIMLTNQLINHSTSIFLGVKSFSENSAGVNAFTPVFSIGFDYRDNQAPTVSITSPTTGNILMGGIDKHIIWTAGDNMGLNYFDLYFSSNNGSTWDYIGQTAGDKRSYSWLPPNINSSQCKIKIVAYDLAGFNATSITGAFTIKQVVLPVNAWLPIHSGSGPIKDIQMIDDNNAWAVGNDGLVLRQTGSSWNKITITGLAEYNLNAIEMKGQYGWIVGEKKGEPGKYTGVIRRSIDYGNTWPVEYEYKLYGTAFKDVSFANNGTGYISCGNGIILKSTNRGIDWAATGSTPITEPSGVSGWFNSIYTDPANSARVRVVGDNYGFISESNDGGEK